MAASWDSKIANAASMTDNCMKLGAVILKPKSHASTGFAPPKPPRES